MAFIYVIAGLAGLAMFVGASVFLFLWGLGGIIKHVENSEVDNEDD